MNVLQLSILLSKDLLTCESFDCYDVFKHGPFQRRLLLFCSLAFFLMNANSFVLHLITSDVGHWCKRPPHSNMSAAPWITSAIPLEPDGSLSRCLRFEHPDEPNNTNTIPCEEWEVEQQLASTTIVSEWNLVCQRRSLITVLVLVHNGACAMFAIAAGSLADSAGRFRVLLVVIITLLVSTAAACLSDSYVVYASLRFFIGGSAAVTMALSLVALLEVTTHAKKTAPHRPGRNGSRSILRLVVCWLDTRAARLETEADAFCVTHAAFAAGPSLHRRVSALANRSGAAEVRRGCHAVCRQVEHLPDLEHCVATQQAEGRHVYERRRLSHHSRLAPWPFNPATRVVPVLFIFLDNARCVRDIFFAAASEEHVAPPAFVPHHACSLRSDARAHQEAHNARRHPWLVHGDRHTSVPHENCGGRRVPPRQRGPPDTGQGVLLFRKCPLLCLRHGAVPLGRAWNRCLLDICLRSPGSGSHLRDLGAPEGRS
ncbi:hypothetical protein HPB48_019118 [Haemaphysalis longicornis]|uniref:Uncharacterized protein n=1 Tax=Haemaphysalis longicornis TaxID=44386 RepID=A0A9J6GCS6_HAELO|nr:hypothetical protein HPB48_019118 [Haemaphysalis longicornis]